MYFWCVVEKKQLPVDQQLSKVRAEHTAENKEKLKSIDETVIHCGRQGIALCGHHDDWKHVEQSSVVNPGNFILLLYFRVQSGDQVVANHLQPGGHRQNALYTSKTIQNELIDVHM